MRGSITKAPIGGGSVGLVSGDLFPGGVAVDSTNVYWSGYDPTGTGTSYVMMQLLAGGGRIVLATGFVNDPIAVGPRGVYGTGAVDGGVTVVSASFAGGAATAVVPASALQRTFASYGIAVDATSVYWTTFSNPGTVMQAPLGGGNPATLASAPGSGFGIAVDATSVYWHGCFQSLVSLLRGHALHAIVGQLVQLGQRVAGFGLELFDGIDAHDRLIRLERYMDCCRTWQHTQSRIVPTMPPPGSERLPQDDTDSEGPRPRCDHGLGLGLSAAA